LSIRQLIHLRIRQLRFGVFLVGGESGFQGRSKMTSSGFLSSRQPKKVVSLNSLIASDVPAGAKPSASKAGVLQMATESEAHIIVSHSAPAALARLVSLGKSYL
jgi:hypothetical protein